MKAPQRDAAKPGHPPSPESRTFCERLGGISIKSGITKSVSEVTEKYKVPMVVAEADARLRVPITSLPV